MIADHHRLRTPNNALCMPCFTIEHLDEQVWIVLYSLLVTHM